MENELTDTLEKKIQHLLDEAKTLYVEAHVNEYVHRYRNHLIEYVKKNPTQSVAAGFVAGYILAKLLKSD